MSDIGSRRSSWRGGPGLSPRPTESRQQPVGERPSSRNQPRTRSGCPGSTSSGSHWLGPSSRRYGGWACGRARAIPSTGRSVRGCRGGCWSTRRRPVPPRKCVKDLSIGSLSASGSAKNAASVERGQDARRIDAVVDQEEEPDLVADLADSSASAALTSAASPSSAPRVDDRDLGETAGRHGPILRGGGVVGVRNWGDLVSGRRGVPGAGRHAGSSSAGALDPVRGGAQRAGRPTR